METLSQTKRAKRNKFSCPENDRDSMNTYECCVNIKFCPIEIAMILQQMNPFHHENVVAASDLAMQAFNPSIRPPQTVFHPAGWLLTFYIILHHFTIRHVLWIARCKCSSSGLAISLQEQRAATTPRWHRRCNQQGSQIHLASFSQLPELAVGVQPATRTCTKSGCGVAVMNQMFFTRNESVRSLPRLAIATSVWPYHLCSFRTLILIEIRAKWCQVLWIRINQVGGYYHFLTLLGRMSPLPLASHVC